MKDDVVKNCPKHVKDISTVGKGCGVGFDIHIHSWQYGVVIIQIGNKGECH